MKSMLLVHVDQWYFLPKKKNKTNKQIIQNVQDNGRASKFIAEFISQLTNVKQQSLIIMYSCAV